MNPYKIKRYGQLPGVQIHPASFIAIGEIMPLLESFGLTHHLTLLKPNKKNWTDGTA